MGFATLTPVNTSSTTVQATHAVNIGSPSSGDRVTLSLAFQSGSSYATSGNITPPTGWTLVHERRGFVWETLWVVLSRECDGSEGATVSVTTANTSRLAARGWVAAAGTFTGAPQAASAAASSSANPNPPPLDPSWGAVDTTWIAFAGAAVFQTFSAYPSGYTNTATVAADPGSNPRIYTGYAERELAADSEDPGTFTWSASANWIAGTIAIQGTASGGSAIAPISSGYHLRGMR